MCPNECSRWLHRLRPVCADAWKPRVRRNVLGRAISSASTLVRQAIIAPEHERRVPIAVLAAAFLFNLGQGVLRPSMPLYMQKTFAANYSMVTLIPVVFGAGKWIANLPAGYLLGRRGRPLMICGLLVVALVDVASVVTSRYDVFLGLRALGGVGWAMSRPSRRRRRSVWPSGIDGGGRSACC